MEAKPVRTFAALLAASLLLLVRPALAADSGTLVFRVQSFTSEIDLKPKIQARLESGGLEWGLHEHELVVTLVNKRFVGVDIPYLTRFGTEQELQLPAGEYTLSCVGMIPEGGLSVEKALSRGAYVNDDVLRFTIRAGERTELQVLPVIRKKSTFLLKFFIPELTVKVIENGDAGEERSVNLRDEHSVAWDEYSGPLKFVAAAAAH
jgi:hypothetical protein